MCFCHIEWCYRVISRLKGFLWRKFNYGILLCMCDLQGVRINLWMESITRACTFLDHTISFQNISCFALYLIFNQNNFLSTWEYRLLCRYWYFSCNISISVSIFLLSQFPWKWIVKFFFSLGFISTCVDIILGTEDFWNIYFTMSSYEHSRSWDSCSPMSPHEILKSKQRFRIDEVGVLYRN